MFHNAQYVHLPNLCIQVENQILRGAVVVVMVAGFTTTYAISAYHH